MLFMGLDVGTQGVRCIVVDERGEIAAAHSVPFVKLNIAAEENRYEQSPDDWTGAASQAIRACTSALDNPKQIVAVSIDGTSGTIVALDKENRPLTNGIMYNDPRAKAQAARVHAASGNIERKMGYSFGSSFSLPRILWLHDEMPDIYDKSARIVHQADYVAGMLCGEYGVSDYSNALKTGYDLIDDCWPEIYANTLDIDLSKLPKIVRPGEAVAHISKDAAERLGLPESAIVCGGSTDGYASALAAGAVSEGRWASIIGTTFVLKGVTKELVCDPSGACYSHKLPSGEWMPGGASNLGGRALNGACGGRSFDEMNAIAEGMIPTGVRCYPLTGRGERFPFVKSDCEAFYIGDITGDRLYPAIMEGVGFAERYTYDHMRDLGCFVGDTICTAGGVCKSGLWLRIRASILNKQLIVPGIVDAAMGSALLAASGYFGSLKSAADNMLRFSDPVDPEAEFVKRYEEIYQRFTEDMKRINFEGTKS